MSIYKRKDTGMFEVSVSYKKADGTYGRYTKYCHTKKEAQNVEPTLILKSKGMDAPKTEIRFSDLVNELLHEYEKELRKSTVSNYEKISRLYLIPYFGKCRVSSLTTIMVKDWKETMRNQVSPRYGKPFSLSFLQKVYFTFKSIMRFASHQHGIDNDCVSRAENFKKDPNEHDPDRKLNYWTVQQFSLFCGKAQRYISTLDPLNRTYMVNCSCFVLISICFFAGLRKGEANALTVADFVDGDHPYLHVNKSVTEKIPGIKYLVTDPKTQSSKRDVPIPNVLVDIIRQHINYRLCRIDGFAPTMFLCGGQIPVADESINQFRTKFQRESGIPYIRIHDLRHSYASILINSHIDIPTVAKLMGHSNTSVTYKTYYSLFPKTSNEAVDMVNSSSDLKLFATNLQHTK
jgi:integrase